MADIGFGSHESDRDAVANLALAQIGNRRQRIFIGRAKAGRALHRANDIGPGFLQNSSNARRLSRRDRRGNGLCMSARPQSLNFIEGEVRPVAITR